MAGSDDSTSTSSDDEPPAGAPPQLAGRKRQLSKQLSLRETSREANWERRRRQVLQRRHRMMATAAPQKAEAKAEAEAEAELVEVDERKKRMRSLTDEDLDELRGSIELGFGFCEDDVDGLCDTLPALGLYFAVNKLQRTSSSVSASSASSGSLGGVGAGGGSPRGPYDQQLLNDDDWKICNPGDDPQCVKTRLRHWAQVVACSLMHGC